jgi:hypothetical protein
VLFLLKSEGKTDLEAKNFSDVYHSHDDSLNSIAEQIVASFVEFIQLDEVELTPEFLIPPTEVRNIIRVLRLTKAAELDLIDN